MIKHTIMLKCLKAYDCLIKLVLIILCIINYLNFWLITSDVPIYIDANEFKWLLILNFTQLALNALLVLNSIIRKSNNTGVLAIEVFFLCLWVWNFKHGGLYADIEHYIFTIAFSAGCLFIGVSSQLLVNLFLRKR